MSPTRRVLLLTGAAVFLAAFDGSTLFLALPAIAHEFHARVSDLSNVGSILGLGSLAALPLAALADRAGRRRVLAAAVAGFCLANLATFFATGLVFLALARLVASCFEVVAITVAGVLVVEEVAAERRAFAIAGLTVAGGGGGGLTTILYPLLAPNWRLLYLLGSVGIVAAPVIWKWLPESRLFLPPQGGGRPGAGRGFLLLWDRPWRRRLIVLSLFSLLSAIAFTPGGLLGAVYASQDLRMSPTQISAVLLVTGTVASAGYLAGGWISDRTGRRAPAVGLSLLAAAMSIITYLGTVLAFWAGNLGYLVVASAVAPIVVTWFAELFPTRARATSQAVATVLGALGGIAGLQLVGALSGRIGLGPALVGVGLAPLAGALVLGFLPETRGEPLPD